MKKFILFASVFAGLFTAASCQRENLEPATVNGTVTYTVEVPGAVATKSGVASDGVNNVNELVYEVYRIVKEEVVAGENVITLADDVLYRGTAPVSAGKATCKVDYINNQNHMVLFWAHQADNGLYNVGNLRNVTVNASVAGNTHANAAFTGKDILRNGVSDCFGSVKLTRPVAQLNIATTKQSLALENGRVVEVSESEVTVSGLSASFNVATGEVSGDASVTYTSASADLGDLNDSYKLLSMNYVGFVPADGANVTVDYTLTTSEGEITNEISSVPVKRNIRTNIIGNLISNKSDYDVELDPDWGGADENVVVVSDAASLQDAINNATEGDEIKLEGDIDINDLLSLTKAVSTPSLNVPNGKNITLNLNGYNLTAEESSTGSYGLINNAGTLTIMNSAETVSTISLKATNDRNTNAYSSVISNQPGGNLTVLSNVTIKHLGGTYMAYGIDNLTNGGIGDVNATIDGATVESTYRAVRQFLNSDSKENNLTVKKGSVLSAPNKGVFFQDPSAKANNGKLVIEDGANVGTVYLYVTEGSTEWPVNVSIAASAVEENGVTYKNVPAGYAVENVEGVWTVAFHPVAMIGEKGYVTLIDAVAAVQDGETITLVADEIFTETNYYNNGGWKDGLGYSGDKSFTIDLGGYTIKQDGSLNDYLVWIKNDGAKANTITFKNGTMDAGTTAYCAIATASTNAQKLTVNLENINLINNISNGAVVKARGGSELNVKAGTVITGKNSYTGIEAAGTNTVVNVYEGAEIYQNGTSSYVGAIVGASQNATLNIYGGKGKSAKCGIIVMSTGATINVSGGEWTANGDGTVSNDNAGVLVSQNNRYESSWACKSILNVTGGTFKGGYNCYGMGPGVEADDAQINISGGNFNADPKSYVIDGYKAVEADGAYNVIVDPAAKIGETEYATLQEAFNVGGDITLLRDITVSETLTLASGVTAVLDLNGKTLSAADKNVLKNDGGILTIKNGTVTRSGDVVGYAVNNASGEITVQNATIQRGLYTSGSKMTATDANISHDQSTRHTIYSWDCEVTINSGTFHNGNAGNATLMASGSSVVTINGGTFSIADGRSSLGWTSSMIDQNSTAQVLVKGGLFNGGFRINSATTELTIEGGEFNTNNGSAFTDSSGIKVVKGGKFTDAGAQNWAKKYIAEGYEMNANGEVVAK